MFATCTVLILVAFIYPSMLHGDILNFVRGLAIQILQWIVAIMSPFKRGL